MVNPIQTVKAKYYTYVPGEFMPVYVDGGNKLYNTREFHKYKLRRAKLYVQNYKIVYKHYTHQVG